MKVETFYSGSSGNLYRVTGQNGNQILLECGVTWKKLLKALSYDISKIKGAFVSHFHNDHSCSVEAIIKAGIDVYTSNSTFKAKGVSGRRCKEVEDGTLVKDLAGFQLLFFDTIHDAEGSLGVVVYEEATKERLLFVTDTAYVKQNFNFPFDIIMLGCSFDREILEAKEANGEIDTELAKRLRESHQEKQTAMDYLDKYCDLSHCRQLHLLHMSSSNIDKEKTVKEFENRFAMKVVTV